MRSGAALLLMVGCQYQPTRQQVSDAPRFDAPASDEPDGPPVDPCSVPDPTGLVVCFTFDQDFAGGTLVDGSGNGFDATTSGLTPTPRPVGNADSRAAIVGSTSSTHVPDDPALDLTTPYTLSAWLNPTAFTTGNQGVIEHEAQYAITLTPNTGALRCWLNTAGGLVIHAGSTATVGIWQFAACTWDGGDLCTILINSGQSARSCVTPLSSTIGAGNDGLWLGTMAAGGIPNDRIAGAIDDVRIYRRTLLDDELCTLADRAPGCIP